MTFINLLGEREATTQNSENYKSKIIEYMQQRGFLLVKDSSVDGTLADLTFKRPLCDGEKETKIEAKFDDISIFDKKFLLELYKYFIAYINTPKKFFLYIFVRKCKAIDNWKKVFDQQKLLSIEINQLKLKMDSALEDDLNKEFQQYTYDQFLNFITDCEVIQADYNSLDMKVDVLKKDGKFNVNQKFVTDDEDLVEEREELIGNLLMVEGFPAEIWIADCKKIDKIKEFWNENFTEPIYPSKKKIVSLKEFKEMPSVLKYVETDKIKKVLFSKWLLEDEENIGMAKNLIKRCLIKKGRNMGMKYNPILNCLYYPHHNLKCEIHKANGRKSSRVFYKREDNPISQKTFFEERLASKQIKNRAKVNFVEHYGVTIEVIYLSKAFYVRLDLIRLFTEDGKYVILGESAKALHYRFSQRFEFNDSEKSKFLHWVNLFSFRNKPLGEYMLNDKGSPYKEFFTLSNPIKVESKIKSKKGQKYDFIDDSSLFLDYYLDPVEENL